MNDKFTDNNRDEDIARKLNQVAEQTHVNAQFGLELEERLRSRRRPRAGWFATFRQVSPTLRWVAFMVLLAVALSWSIKTLIPAPQPAAENTFVIPIVETPTPTPLEATPASPTQAGGYDFRGAKLFLQQPLPESPATAHIYLLNKDEPATQDQARALADRFGIQGETYTAPGFLYGTTNYVISDGKQELQLHSEGYFAYTADMAKSRRTYPKPENPNAESIIREFLTARGFDFPLRVETSEFFNGYVVQPLAPDSIPMQFESFSPPVMRVVLDENGQVLTVDAMLMNYDPAPLGEYGIISAEEALQKLLDDNIVTSKMESVHSAANMPREWYRTYPDNQPISIYGYLSSYPPLDPNKPALIFIDGVPLTGNIAGLESQDAFTFFKATGQFIFENGIRKFNVESWDRNINQAYFEGTLTRQGDQVIFVSNDGSGMQYPIIDPPADLPVDSVTPENSLSVTGVIVNNTFDWTYIQFFESNASGGGGGGGLGFHQLNLSGTPVPFTMPTAPSVPEQFMGIYEVKEGDTVASIAQTFGLSISELIRLNGLSEDGLIFVGQALSVPVPEPTEQRVEDLRGYLSISIHTKNDGSSTKGYGLEVIQETGGSSLYTMEGSILPELDPYNGLPVLVTGTINTSGKLVVDSYKIPYPGLQFQILKGTQRVEQVDGQNVTIFTTEDGISYVEFFATNNMPNEGSVTGNPGDLIQQEVLILPDETFGGLPVAHIYQSAMIQQDGPPMEIQGNKVYVFDEGSTPGVPTENAQPNLIIEKVELVYFVSNPFYQMNDPNYDQRSPYIEPVWHFQGRFEDGTEYDMLIQALKQEFLLPELAPNPGRG